jgi:hypothetical protein
MLSETVLINTIKSSRASWLGLPSRPFQGRLEGAARDFALGDDNSVDQDNRDAPVVKAVELVIRVDIEQLGVEVELLEKGEGLIAQVAALARDQDDLHEPEPTSRA